MASGNKMNQGEVAIITLGIILFIFYIVGKVQERKMRNETEIPCDLDSPP